METPGLVSAPQTLKQAHHFGEVGYFGAILKAIAVTCLSSLSSSSSSARHSPGNFKANIPPCVNTNPGTGYLRSGVCPFWLHLWPSVKAEATSQNPS